MRVDAGRPSCNLHWGIQPLTPPSNTCLGQLLGLLRELPGREAAHAVGLHQPMSPPTWMGDNKRLAGEAATQNNCGVHTQECQRSKGMSAAKQRSAAQCRAHLRPHGQAAVVAEQDCLGGVAPAAQLAHVGAPIQQRRLQDHVVGAQLVAAAAQLHLTHRLRVRRPQGRGRQVIFTYSD